MQVSVPCVLMRGGTSKGIFLQEEYLPPQGEERDRFLIRLMGSPDPRQIDGLGGATSVTSKVAIITKSVRPDADVDYTFAQVGIDKPLVDYKGNCGNILSAIGPYAVEMGYVAPDDPITTVRVFNTNTQKLIIEYVQTPDGKLTYHGDYAISGVPKTAAPVKIVFDHPAGSVFGKLLPTGNPADILEVPGIGSVRVSIVDAANPLVFVNAADLGLSGTELPDELERYPDVLKRLETVRGVAAQLLGLTKDYKKSAWDTPAIPKMTYVTAPCDYQAADGSLITANSVDLVAHMMSMQKPHQTYAMTGSVCTACAAVIPGTTVYEVRRTKVDCQKIRIGHPNGIIESGVEYTIADDGTVSVDKAFGFRTARLLMKGAAYLD
jgi:2-methylaconitate cis-trans-isomerase PrpF